MIIDSSLTGNRARERMTPSPHVLLLKLKGCVIHTETGLSRMFCYHIDVSSSRIQRFGCLTTIIFLTVPKVERYQYNVYNDAVFVCLCCRNY